MTLPSAPASISAFDINVELNIGGTTCFPVNATVYRTLAGVPTPSSQISWSNFYGKTRAFGQVAQCQCGGWYMGCTTACGVNYYLIAAPNAPGFTSAVAFRSGCNVCGVLPVMMVAPFGTNPTAADDGFCITKFIQACPSYGLPIPTPIVTSYPLLSTTWALNIGGFSDWYMPAINELVTLWCNTDQAWLCGGAMKTSGNQFPQNGIVRAPCFWPYLGYPIARAPAPLSAPSELGFTCGSGWGLNCWVYPLYIGLSYANCTMSTTAMNSNPFAACPTNTQMSGILWQLRFNCTPTWPQPAANIWAIPQRCINQVTRAVRRVAF